MGTTLSAIIRIRNSTDTDITSVLAYEIDTYDFGNFQPDKVFNGIPIPSHTCIEKTIDFSAFSSNSPFTMKLLFKDNTEDVFRLNYKCVFDGDQTNVRHLTKSHVLKLKKTGPRVLEITLQNTEDQLENNSAKTLISDGCKLMDMGKYNEASVKFMEAAQKVNENNTILDLQKHSHRLKKMRETMDDDKRAKTLNNEGIQLLKTVKFNEALRKFDEALQLAKNMETISLIEDNLKITRDAKKNQDAKKLKQEGLQLRITDPQAASAKFDEALQLAVDATLITSIRRNKADTLTTEAEEVLKKAWELEASSPEDAIHHFAKAKFLFQEADSVKSNVSYQQSISLIDLKMEGDKHFSTGLQLEQEGSRLIDKTVKSERAEDCKIAKDKYEVAWKSYKEALKKYEEGRTNNVNFEGSLTLVRGALDGIERILNELEKAEIEIVVANM